MDQPIGRGVSDKHNVFFLKPQNPLFPPSLRTKLETGVKTETGDPKKLVDNLEDALCAWLVSSVRQFVTKVVSGTGKVLVDKIVGA